MLFLPLKKEKSKIQVLKVYLLGIFALLCSCKDNASLARESVSNSNVSSELFVLGDGNNDSGSTFYTLQSNIPSENEKCDFAIDSVLSFKELPSERLHVLKNEELKKIFGPESECNCYVSVSEFGRITNFSKNWQSGRSYSEPVVAAINGKYSIRENKIVNQINGEPYEEMFIVFKSNSGRYYVGSFGQNCAVTELKFKKIS